MNQTWAKTIGVVILVCVFTGVSLIIIKTPELDTSSVQLTVFNDSGVVLEPRRRESDSVIAPAKWYPVGDDGATRIEINADWSGDAEETFSGHITYQLLTERWPQSVLEVILIFNFTVTTSKFNDTRQLDDLLPPDGYDEWVLVIIVEVEGWSASHISCYYLKGED